MAHQRSPLDEDRITRALQTTDGWERRGDRIRKDFRFADFDHAMEFVNAVADIARELDHHPELTNVYDRVALEVTTHDAGGLTDLDFAFAHQVDALLRDGGVDL